MYVKQNAITATAHEVNADWVIVVDADEFIFPMSPTPANTLEPMDPRTVFLKRLTAT